MRDIFTFTVTTTDDLRDPPGFFTTEGEFVGRVLRCNKNDVDPKHIFYSYDVESSAEMFERLSCGVAKLYKVDDYTIGRSSTHWVRKV